MNRLHEARYWEAGPDDRVTCLLCPHHCKVSDGRVGACGVRGQHRGRLVTLAYDRIVGQELDPIEKKPLFHFHPGSTAWSIATVGCNLRCTYCQNWSISQWGAPGSGGHRLELSELAPRVPGTVTTPEEVVASARRLGALSIAYTYTEPTIFYELAYDTAERARAAGLFNVWISNGFIDEAPLAGITPLLDAANIDLKFFRDELYRRVSRSSLTPVLRTIRQLHAAGVWVEATTLLIPGLNDDEGQLREMAAFLADVDPALPWHLSRFFPAWRMRDRPPTPLPALDAAARIGREAGLRHVYVGNVMGGGQEATRCHACDTLLLDRRGHRLVEDRLVGGGCPTCGTPLAGVGFTTGKRPLEGPLPAPMQ